TDVSCMHRFIYTPICFLPLVVIGCSSGSETVTARVDSFLSPCLWVDSVDGSITYDCVVFRVEDESEAKLISLQYPAFETVRGKGTRERNGPGVLAGISLEVGQRVRFTVPPTKYCCGPYLAHVKDAVFLK